MAILGFGSKHLKVNTPCLKHATEAALAFYIIHQTVVVGVGYFAVQWAIPDLLKWASVIVISFAITVGLYEVAVRRFNVMRVLFGMKPVWRQLGKQPQES